MIEKEKRDKVIDNLNEAFRCVKAVRVRRGSLKKRNPLYLHIETARRHLEETLKILEGEKE